MGFDFFAEFVMWVLMGFDCFEELDKFGLLGSLLKIWFWSWSVAFLKVGFDCFGELGMWVLVGTMFCVGDGLVRAVKYERGGEDLDV